MNIKKRFNHIKYYTSGDFSKYGEYIHDRMIFIILLDELRESGEI